MTGSSATGRSPRASGRRSCGPAGTSARSLVTGVSEAQFELLKWYFVEVDDDTGFDAAADVIARAVARVAPGTPVGASAAAAIEARDLLEDLDEVLGDGRVRLARPARPGCAKLAPAWSAVPDADRRPAP